ncbi:TPA: membrane-bound lytic murein transglycosylase MltF [Photobacterium damselae]|uniref:Membrane-bound lytic murein transglycosylase F n=2 Tax=Photobacterium damselae TaxID=38293 RepID=A0A850QIP9_PHODD|nr:membrane-bound lytic murein transglycosylase MltF [Photobacterium damselae]ELI6446921.1 membrane-bound lytic murein transglycosylase MltF [Photobacterium damselae]ELV7515082.1 membrane-bound lytic murein transglycosylase MltF [Photobacterium damselae]KAB1178939.1 membrane-bound lytic murein transglycosylase MltF [Photobacterium damselae subsp. damselae]MBA5683335.1 membrane-bound lytic murein transglycosylase MltF [Photobacterium damselae subsp. damselae]NVH47655.1 membrane-bound lytic mure
MLSTYTLPKKIRQYFVSLITLFLISGCQWQSEPHNALDRIRETGVLRVGTLNNQLSYYIGNEGPTGLDYELAQLFAKKLGVKLEMQPMFSLSSLFPALDRGNVDILAAGLTITPNRLQDFRATPAYYYASQLVVYKKGTWRPRTPADLAKNKGTLTVVKGSSHELQLKQLQQKYPDLKWQAVSETDDDELMRDVASGKLDFTIADSVDVALIQRIHPDIAIAMELTDEEPISWFVKNSSNDNLYALIIEFFGEIKQNGELAQLEEKYFGHVDQFDYVDTRAFLRAVEGKLPKWKPLFKQYAGEFDWRLIAALSYQESHWNPEATSPTGVRGMMMLTTPTAKAVDVANRLDPKQSIRGGTEYLRRMIARVPDSIESHEKVWFALASYNIGFGHLMDARRLTKAQGGNPDTWTDVKQRLPMLRQRQYYTQTRYGYARGDEALNYVENIRRYYQSIVGYEQAHSREHQGDGVEIVDGLQTITPQTISAAAKPQPAKVAASK